MSHSAKHTLHAHQGHLGWNNVFPPLLTIAPGETVAFEINDASGGQITPSSDIAAVTGMDFGRVNPVTGPVAIDGAQPGDALKVTLLSLSPTTTAGAHLWKYRPDLGAPALFGPGGKVPLRPFTGTIGVAPAALGLHSIVPPRRVGGNMDIRDIAAGSELYLPVEVAGALFSVGDTHAAQGDGEVCGTAIESPMSVALKFELVKGAALAYPRFTTPGPVTRHLDAAGYEVTTGIGPDLMAAARDAVSGMIDLLSRRHGMAAVDAYMLCSVCADLRISSIVDVPNWVVSLYFPRVVLD